jgi:hypothetical protein
LDNVWTSLGNYEILKRQGLENDKGEIIELVLFYGDEDGVASFSNFQKQFADKSKWEISKTDYWTCIHSISEKPLVIYANLPLDSKQELDLKAQEQLMEYFKEQSLQPAVLVHRGHSYHLDNTLNMLTPSVRLAILGSCGGYNKAISIASINPDVQVIGSKRTGSMSINDPILYVINDNLIKNKDLYWPEIWDQLNAKFSKDENTMALFNEYFPPSKDLSLFVLKLFIHNYRELQILDENHISTSSN